MGAVQVIFLRHANIGSQLLRRFDWFKFTHCAIVDGDEVIEAMMFKGVRTLPLAEFKANASAWEIIEIPCANPAAVIKAARSQIGAPYDWFGILGLFVRASLHLKRAWFCSELIAWAFKTGGTPLFRVESHRIKPRDIYIRTY